MEQSNDKHHNLKKSPEEIENAIIELFVTVYSRTVGEISKEYGEKGFELARNAFIDSIVDRSIAGFKKIEKRDLKAYVDWLLRSITIGHKYEIIEDKKDSISLKFTECPWATFFRSIGKPEIGKFFCDTDKPMAEAFNKNIKFERTKTLMEGDNYCNHHYFIKKEI